jgi:hypothetical protein
MRERILAATARETHYSMLPTLAIANWQPDPVDVDAEVESLFGPIPDACRAD